MGSYTMGAVQGKCRACPWDMSDPRHFREHIPPQHWPRSMFKHRERYVIRGKVYNPNRVGFDEWGNPYVLPESPQTPPETPTAVANARPVCSCGWVPKVTSLHPENDIRLHKTKSKAHKVKYA